MASTSQASTEGAPSPKRNEYQPPTPNDLRSPCPILNACANHGLIPRDGRGIRAQDLDIALQELGLSIAIRKTLIWGALFERYDNQPSGIMNVLRNPLAYLHWHFGIRDIDQKDSNNTACLNLDQLSRHGAIEHDVSMTRRDFAQGGNNWKAQDDLIAQLLQSSSDGVYITTADFATLRKKRLEQQREDNKELCFPSVLHFVTAGQIAATQGVFGDGDKGHQIPVSYVEALFREERLPVKEGWRKKGGWMGGVVGIVAQLFRVRFAIGSAGSVDKPSRYKH
ncbi:MAG: hypothetical protein Q9223_002409 [Gallowayella weberi]